MIKAAIEREKSDARISSSECEQARSAASMFNVQFEKSVGSKDISQQAQEEK